MHKSVVKIYKNSLRSEEYGDLDCIGPQVGWADGDDDGADREIEIFYHGKFNKAKILLDL